MPLTYPSLSSPSKESLHNVLMFMLPCQLADQYWPSCLVLDLQLDVTLRNIENLHDGQSVGVSVIVTHPTVKRVSACVILVIIEHELSISLHIQTQHTWLAVPDMDSCITCIKSTAFYKPLTTARLPTHSHELIKWGNVTASCRYWNCTANLRKCSMITRHVSRGLSSGHNTKASWDLRTIMWGVTFPPWWLTLLLMYVLVYMQERMLPVLDGIGICNSVVARQLPTVPSPLFRRNELMMKTVV